MYIPLRNILALCLCLYISQALLAQTDAALQLEERVQQSNDARQYLSSLKCIDSFINRTNEHYDLYYAYLLKSYTYKRLFNYDDALRCLDLAYRQGIQSNRKQEVEAIIKSEQAFAYFDIQEYAKSDQLMKELRADNYRFLSGATKSFIVMQEGYIFYLDQHYTEAEKYLDEAVRLMSEHNPRDLPMVYGKKVELYNQTKQPDKREEAFRTGLDYAKKYGILKYEMYMYEMLKKEYARNEQYKEVYGTGLALDSITRLYDAANNSTLLKIYEKNIELKEKAYQLRKNQTIRNFLSVIIVILIVLIILACQLIRSNKKKHQLLEKEYARIYEELTILAQKKNDKDSKIDLASYPLTPRQLEIIEFLRAGKTNKQIASELHISENTVKYHIKSIYEILQVESRTQLFRFFKS